MRFSTNHDYAARNSPLTLYNSLDGANAAFVIALTMGGVPMVYASQEIAYPVKLSFFKNNAVVMDWDLNSEVLQDLLQVYGNCSGSCSASRFFDKHKQ